MTGHPDLIHIPRKLYEISLMVTELLNVKRPTLLIKKEKLKYFLCETCIFIYEGCSSMNASSFITFFTYMLRQNGKRFYKGLYVTFKLAPDIKNNTVYLSNYSPLNEGQVSILTNSMLRTYTSDIDERIILR